jgi:hypothetical protein
MLGFTKRKDVQRQDTIAGQVRVSTVKKDGPDFGDLKLSQCLQVQFPSPSPFVNTRISLLPCSLSPFPSFSISHLALHSLTLLFPFPLLFPFLITRRMTGLSGR